MGSHTVVGHSAEYSVVNAATFYHAWLTVAELLSNENGQRDYFFKVTGNLEFCFK